MTQEEFNLVSTRSEAFKSVLGAFQVLVYFRPTDVTPASPEWLALVDSFTLLSEAIASVAPAPAGARMARDLT